METSGVKERAMGIELMPELGNSASQRIAINYEHGT
jgi:hypothetical protein